MFPKAPVRIERVLLKTSGSDGIKVSKMFDAERKELTENKCLEELSSVNIL